MRITSLKDVLFPVEMQPILRDPSGPEGRPAMTPVRVGGWRAVVDVERGAVFTVVTKNYRLVTNEEALACGKVAFTNLFRSVDVERDMEVFNVVTPSTRSFCHVDLIHREYRVNLWKREVYLPYLRVTNSYNKKKALHFDLGFARELCDNGVIFEKATVRFKKPHTHQHLHESITFLADGTNLGELMEAFRSYMTALNRLAVPINLAQPLMAHALGLSFEVDSGNKKRDQVARRQRDAFKARAGDLLLQYLHEHGPTAYAVFNAATDFASRPAEELLLSRGVHDLQSKVGAWAETFPAEARRDGFSLERYVERERSQLAA